MGCPVTPLLLAGMGGSLLYALLPLVPLWAYLLSLLLSLGAWLLLFDADARTWLTARLQGVDESQLRERVVWVVGASSGIGAEVARQAAAAGAKVVLSARRADELQRVARQLREAGARHEPLVLPLDVLDQSAHAPALQSLLSKHGRLDLLVSNVGRTQRALAAATSVDVTRALLELNVTAMVGLVVTALPQLAKQGEGTILVTSSVSGKLGAPLSSSYSASKHALQGYFDALRLELCEHPAVRVCVACPGPVNTPIEDAAFTAKLGETHKSAEDVQAKMAVERCAHLMLVQATRGIDESWIAKQPILLFTYLAQYAPSVARFLGRRLVAPARLRAFRTGADPYNTKVLLGGLASSISGGSKNK